MAAGLGFKDFTTGEVLTAADVDGYLMQGVWVFASAAARDAAVTSPQEGNFAYLKDTNVTTYYTGSAWTNLDTTGMTNPMTTTGDTIYSSSGSTPARLGIGSTGQVLTVAGGVPSWATPASSSSGLTLVKTQSIGSGVSSVNVTSAFSSTYDHYQIFIYGGVFSSSSLAPRIQLGSTTSGYYAWGIFGNATSTTVNGDQYNNVGYIPLGGGTTNMFFYDVKIFNPNLADETLFATTSFRAGTGNLGPIWGSQDSTTQFTEFTFNTGGSGSMTGGTIAVYGYQKS